MTFKPLSIVVVPFPFTDKIQTKRRPALVLSSIDHQIGTEHVSLMMITSAKYSNWPSDYEIKQLKNTGLHTASIIRQKIFTIDSRLVIESIGELSETDIKNVKIRLKKHLSIK